MNAKQLFNVRVVLGVLVCFVVSGNLAFGDVVKQVSPQALNRSIKIAVVKSNEIKALDEKLDALEAKLDGHDEDFARMERLLQALAERDPSHPYLKAIEDVNKALAELSAKLKEFEKAKKSDHVINVNIDNKPNIDIKVNGNSDGSYTNSAIRTLSSTFSRIITAVKYLGPTVINLYIARSVLNLMQEHRLAMTQLMAEIARIAAERGIDVPNVVAPGAQALPLWVQALPYAPYAADALIGVFQFMLVYGGRLVTKTV